MADVTWDSPAKNQGKKYTKMNRTIVTMNYKANEHEHADCSGKGLCQATKTFTNKLIVKRHTPTHVWNALQDETSLIEKPTYEVVKSYVYNTRPKLLADDEIETYAQYMERAKDANLLFMHRDNDTTDEHEPGVLAFFDGKFLSPVNTYVPLPDERFATEESLPPVPTEATAILDLLQPWKRDKWKIEYDEAEKELTDSIRALGRTSGAQFFLEQLKNLLTAHNWSFHKHTFFVGQTRLKAFYTAYKQLVQDYHGTGAPQAIHCHIHHHARPSYVLFIRFKMLQRDDTYKLLRCGLPVETGGTSSASRYALVYVAVKSHEDDLMIGVGLFYQANRRFPKNVEFMLLALCKVVDEGGELPDMYDVEGTYTEDDLVIAFCYFHTLSVHHQRQETCVCRCG
eukprot:gene15814-18755_t